MRPQNAQQNGNRQATSTGKHSQRAKTRTSMTTEYQEKFLPPQCYKTIILTSTQKDPYHPLKGTSADVSTMKSYYVIHKWKNPPKAPQQAVPPQCHQRCTSAPHKTVCFVENKRASKVEDSTSVYQNDFRAWKPSKRQQCKLTDSLKVRKGLVVPNEEGRSHKVSVQVADNSKAVPQVQQPQPFESITSYRSDYVSHPVQPRTRRGKPVYQPNKGMSEPAVFMRPKVPWDIKQELDEGSEFIQQFKTWSFETKFHSQAKAKDSNPPADHKFLSTTHADYTAHRCQRTKPVLPSMQASEKSKLPFQAMHSIGEDYKACDTPQRFPAVHEEKLDWPKKTTFSVRTPKPAESCTTNPKPFSLHPKLKETAVCKSSCNATKSPHSPASNGVFSGSECIPTGTGESRRYWTSSFDRGVTTLDGDTCEKPREAHQEISCTVSYRR